MNRPTNRTVDPLAVLTQMCLGGVYGWAIWAASPIVTGEVEPWDSMTAYYSGTLFAAGFLSALFWRHGFYWGPIGIYVGQIAYLWLAHHPGGPIIFPAVFAVALFGTIQPIIGALLGWAVGFGVRIVFRSPPIKS